MEKNLRHLVWVNTSPFDGLDISTWLFTTKELRKLGWMVTLIAPDEPGTHEKLGVEYTGIRMPDIYLIRQLIFHNRVKHFINKLDQRPDVVMFHEFSVPSFFFSKIARMITGRKSPVYVQDIRSLPMQPENIAGVKDRVRSFYFYLENKLANLGAVDGRITITRPMAEALNIPPDRFWGTWSSGVQPEMFDRSAGNRDWSDVGRQVKLIYIGSMSDGRNLALFARAVIEANRQGMNFHITFVGGGTEMNDLLRLEKDSGGCIRVQPPVPHDTIQDWLTPAHIGILPFPDELKFRVSSPIKLFEYAAAGLAILATRITCHTNVIGDGKYVVWAEESTLDSLVYSLKNAWENRMHLQEMGKLARLESTHWTWTESALNLANALDLGMRKNGS
ncbi:MAG: glycosyltransferase family 4 protein [Leptolinea sp.]|nr:glycosyltransferase family 4 protein [Leptolinea sp.]